MANKKMVKHVPSNRNTHLKQKKKKRLKLKYGRILLLFMIVILIGYVIYFVFTRRITNFYIFGNVYFSDQEILEMAKLENYPAMMKYSTKEIEKRLEKNIYIQKASIKKKSLHEMRITIKENRPLFYNKSNRKTVLEDGSEVSEMFSVPILINYVPKDKYEMLVEKMKEIESDILNRVSEIKYDPNDVDEYLFLLSMTDGNYVYLTLPKFDVINKYVEISKEVIKKHGNKKGVFYLDSGNSFELLENVKK